MRLFANRMQNEEFMKTNPFTKSIVSLFLAGVFAVGLGTIGHADTMTGTVRIRVTNTATTTLPNGDTVTRRKKSTRSFSLILAWVKGTGEYALYIVDRRNRKYVKQTGTDLFGIQYFPDMNKNKAADIQRVFLTNFCDSFDYDNDTVDDTVQSKQGSMTGRETNLTKAFGHKTRDVRRVAGQYKTQTNGNVIPSAKMESLFPKEIDLFSELSNPMTGDPYDAPGFFSSEMTEFVSLSYNRNATETFSDFSFSNTQAKIEDALDQPTNGVGVLFRMQLEQEPMMHDIFADGFESGDATSWTN